MLKVSNSTCATARVAFVVCLVAICCRHGAAKNCSKPDEKSSFCVVFQRLRDVIPAKIQDYITRKHYQHDVKFRHAMEFLQTDEFAAAALQIEQSVSYRQLLQEFINQSINTTDFETIRGVLVCIIPHLEPEDGAHAMAASRSLQSYAQEMMKAMPHDQFRELLSSEMVSNEQLRKFYQIIRSPAFQQRASRFFASRDIRKPICVLRRNYIDLRKLVSYGFQVFSWGPTEY